MQVQVSRWGNSLGLRIPKDVASRAGLREGARVEVETEGDWINDAPNEGSSAPAGADAAKNPTPGGVQGTTLAGQPQTAPQSATP